MNVSNLHPYQKQAVFKALEAIQKGEKHFAFVMPPATGKTGVSVNIVHDYLKGRHNKAPGNVLVVTRSKDSQYDLSSAFKFDDLPIGINLLVKPDTADHAQITILSLLGLSKVEPPLKASGKNFGLIIVMGGGANSSSLNELFDIYPDAIQILILDHAEENNERFGVPIYEYTLKTAIEDDYFFKPFVVKQMSVLPSDLKQEISLFSPEVTEKAIINSKSYMENAAKIMLGEIKGGKTIVYCPNIFFAEEFAKIINEQRGNGAYASTISNNMDEAVRLQNVVSYKDNPGDPNILCMVSPNVHTNHFNITKTVAIFRKTTKVSLLQSMLVPGLRHFPGKKELDVLDFVGLKDLFDVLGGIPIIKAEIPSEPDSVIQSSAAKQYFQKSNISFRDKKEIEGVLGIDDLAEELAEIIQIMPAEQGSMIGIFGKWGRGKTFLIEHTWKKLAAKKTFVRVEFHAWKYQDTPATWAYLYECISDAYFKPECKWKFWSKVVSGKRLICLNFERKGVWPIFKFIAILSAGIFSFVLGKQLLGLIEGKAQASFNSLGAIFTGSVTLYALYTTIKKEYSVKAKDLFLKYAVKQSFKEHLGVQAEIQKETLTLLKSWIPENDLKVRKIVLFVEDIDRCSEAKIIQIIDSLRMLLEDPEVAKRIIVVAAIDERMLKLAIKMKYNSLIAIEKKDAEHTKSLNKITDEYIDKLFIAGFKLGDLSKLDSDEFLVELTRLDREKEAVSKLQDILDAESKMMSARTAQHLQDALDYQIEQMQNEDYTSYDEPDYHTEYLENSDVLQDTETSTSPTPFAEPETAKSLSDEEIDILRVSVAKYKGATPRQIRIFYYRYLIAKNLLIRRYGKLKRTNVWQTDVNSRILSTLIVLYTINEEEGILSKHLESALSDTRDQHTVQLLTETMVSGYDYRELLTILSVVIAY
ncbi:hypothetical protein AY601_1779 [Pedobacter cryoconitis]|uniref:KAP-like P-loop domain-containing protein n=1 Tax=Pedobacter cryoconitis TaxID=188932 RepID=A0A127VBY2_9SPHI|nr:P-loop NTPase fold protein [Pedobacter cryoconitis]AMP98691.1 hypothetical protein AY601_1779 [Pedobacter cryoconitis]